VEETRGGGRNRQFGLGSRQTEKMLADRQAGRKADQKQLLNRRNGLHEVWHKGRCGECREPAAK
jgi:Spy/CpxP family protein refolding chaperone